MVVYLVQGLVFGQSLVKPKVLVDTKVNLVNWSSLVWSKIWSIWSDLVKIGFKHGRGTTIALTSLLPGSCTCLDRMVKQRFFLQQDRGCAKIGRKVLYAVRQDKHPQDNFLLSAV